MNKIKFRYYRLKKKEMVYGFKGCALDYVLNLWEQERRVSQPMQCSGLVDCNGKDIYEGDIIQCNDEPKDIWSVNFGEFGVADLETQSYVDIALGYWLKAEHDLKSVMPFGMDMPLTQRSVKRLKGKVVGNIHENPELLINEN